MRCTKRYTGMVNVWWRGGYLGGVLLNAYCADIGAFFSHKERVNNRKTDMPLRVSIFTMSSLLGITTFLVHSFHNRAFLTLQTEARDLAPRMGFVIGSICKIAN